MSQWAIEIKGLRKSFGKQTVLSGIDMKVRSGEVFALLGPNGAGKTTLINILSTLVPPDEGKVKVAGYDVVANKNEVKRSISLTGQFAAVDEVLTARENLKMACRLSGLAGEQARKRTEELLERFDLKAAAGKRAKTFSGGMRRRLDLAISLAVIRPVLFLDEPTTGLDTMSRRALWDIILELKRQGVTVFLTTQYLEEADELADTITVMGGGRVIASGTAEELKARVGGDVIELRDENDEVIRTMPTNGSVRDVRQALVELAPQIAPETRVHIRRPSLDDVFVALTANPTESEGAVS